MRCGVRGQIGVVLVGQRPAAAAASLVEQDDAVSFRIEETSLARSAARTRPAVQVQRGLAVGITAALPAQAMTIRHVEHAAVIWLDLRKSALHEHSGSPPSHRSLVAEEACRFPHDGCNEPRGWRRTAA